MPRLQNWNVQEIGKITLFGILWAVFFALAYTQSPLYTSNQNQYFLQGLAQAGYGNLAADWLANTQDPTPLFSSLVELTYRWLPWPPIFYVYYAVLLGVYLWSLYIIVRAIFPSDRRVLFRLLFLSGIVLLHSAGWRFLLSRILGIEWTYVVEDGFAGQRMLGPVFQPSSFGVFLAVSVALFLKKRPFWAVLFAALAAVFHPVYLFSAGVLTLAYLFVLWREGKNFGTLFTLGVFALILVLPIIWRVWELFANAPASLSFEAREILVNFRLPHHALIEEWWGFPALIKIVLLLSGLYASRGTRLFPVLGFGILFGAGLTLFQLISGDLALALLFPWRISVLLIPLSTTILLAKGILWLLKYPWTLSREGEHLLRLGAYGVVAVAVIVGVVRFYLDVNRKLTDHQRAVENYSARHRTEHDLYLTPIEMQDFRLESGAPVLVDFKSIPYRPEDVIEWYQRVRAADSFYRSASCDKLTELITEYELTHIVWPVEGASLKCPDLVRIYQDSVYELYRIQLTK